MVGDEPFFKIFLFSRIVSEGFLKIWRKRMSDRVSELMSYKGVRKTAPATQGLLITMLKLHFNHPKGGVKKNVF